MAKISKIQLPNGDVYDIKDTVTTVSTTGSGNAVTSISASNGALTVNKGSSYIPYNDTMLTTNPFGGKQLYISKIDNALYAADKRWTVTGKLIKTDGTGGETALTANQLALLFDGSYETTLQITKGYTAIIRITFDTADTGSYGGVKTFPGYPYGYIYLSYYYTSTPEVKSKLRVYCNYEAHTLGEHEYIFDKYVGNYSVAGASAGTSSFMEVVRQPVYAISWMEFEVYGAENHNAGLTQIDFKLDRPDSKRTPFLSKFGAETLYYNLSAPSFTEGGTLLSNKYQSKITASNKLSYSLISGTPTIPSAVTESTVSGWGFTKNTGTYSKPSTGIPKTDLASDVQTSLGKADTALQQHQDISGKQDKITESNKLNYNLLSNTPTIPPAITKTTISNWGFVERNQSSGKWNPDDDYYPGDVVFYESTGEYYICITATFGTLPPSAPIYWKKLTPTAGTNITITGNTISAIDTTYESKAASSGGMDVSLVTTGEKAVWNAKQNAITESNKLDYSLLSNTPTIPTIDPDTATKTWVTEQIIGAMQRSY